MQSNKISPILEQYLNYLSVIKVEVMYYSFNGFLLNFKIIFFCFATS